MTCSVCMPKWATIANRRHRKSCTGYRAFSFHLAGRNAPLARSTTRFTVCFGVRVDLIRAGKGVGIAK